MQFTLRVNSTNPNFKEPISLEIYVFSYIKAPFGDRRGILNTCVKVRWRNHIGLARKVTFNEPYATRELRTDGSDVWVPDLFLDTLFSFDRFRSISPLNRMAPLVLLKIVRSADTDMS